MMKRGLAFAVCLAVVFGLASAVSAQTAKKADKASPGMMMMKPAPEMEKINWMVGTWHCTGKSMASPMGPEHPAEAEVKVEKALDGMWVVGHYREKKTAQNPMPISGDEYWTWDSAEKMFDRVVMDSMGGFSTGNSKGWEGDKLAWTMEGMMGGQKMKSRDTFVRKSQSELSLTGEIGTPDGKWAAAYETSCKK
jgi:hypothetical protein